MVSFIIANVIGMPLVLSASFDESIPQSKLPELFTTIITFVGIVVVLLFWTMYIFRQKIMVKVLNTITDTEIFMVKYAIENKSNNGFDIFFILLGSLATNFYAPQQ